MEKYWLVIVDATQLFYFKEKALNTFNKPLIKEQKKQNK